MKKSGLISLLKMRYYHLFSVKKKGVLTLCHVSSRGSDKHANIGHTKCFSPLYGQGLVNLSDLSDFSCVVNITLTFPYLFMVY
jgi:hypothetical protein